MDSATYLQADSLNQEAYLIRYKNLDLSEALALEALEVGQGFSDMKAKALNNLGFCAFMRMDFDRADSLLQRVYRETANELECLVADIGMMKIYQRTSMNKEFYDYRHSALRRMKRIDEDESALKDPAFLANTHARSFPSHQLYIIITCNRRRNPWKRLTKLMSTRS